MTIFEYISIATSLILSFSLARTLTNIAPVFAAERRYWVHGTWVLGLLVYHVTLFWQLWLYQGVEAWTLLEFVLLLLGPVMLLIGVSLLVPMEAVPDYRAYFESMRTPFYSVLIIIQLQPVPLPYLLFEIPFSLHPMLFANLVFAAAAAGGLIARKRAIDMALVCFFVLGITGGLVTMNDHEAMLEAVRDLTR